MTYQPLWRLLGCVAVALTAVVAMPGVGAPAGAAECAVTVACCAAAAGAVRGVRRSGHRDAAALLLTAGLTLYAGAFGLFAAVLLHSRELAAPAPSSVLWAAAYALFVLALALHVRAAAGGWDRVMRLDAGIAALGALTLGAALLDALVAGSPVGVAALATYLAYPIADLVLLGLVAAGYALTGNGLARGWWPIGGALLLLFAGDVGYLLRVLDGGPYASLPIDAAFGLAALVVAELPSRPAPGAGGEATPGPRRPIVPLGCCALAVVVLAADHVHRTSTVAVVLSVATLLLALVRMAGAFAADARLRVTEHEALTDELTGLRNRRALLRDLAAALDPARRGRPSTLALFDLDGFKTYNDRFGHPAGDELLGRLAGRLTAAVGDAGRAYRLGGDEFCVLADHPGLDHALVVSAAIAALRHERDGVSIGCSHGTVALPGEAADPSAALGLADARMYEHKDAHRPSARAQGRDLLLKVLREQQPDLEEHSDDVGALVAAVGRRLGLAAEELEHAERAAELHDVGKVAVPLSILRKPGPLDEGEWAVMRRHTVIGERILASVPALLPVARLVRSSHERWDGGGYPDGLRGEEIPLGARIIAVCDAFGAMVADRSYRAGRSPAEAVAELDRCAGTQFDPAVVAAFTAELAAGGGDAAGPPVPAPRAAATPWSARELDTSAKLRGLLTLHALSRSGTGVDEVLQATAETIAGTLGFRTVAINVAGGEGEELVVRAVVGDLAARAALEGARTTRDSWTELLDPRFERRGAYVVPAAEWPTSVAPGHVPAPAADDPDAWQPGDALLVPLTARDGTLLGIVSVDEPVWGHRPTDDELAVLVALTAHAAYAVEAAWDSLPAGV